MNSSNAIGAPFSTMNATRTPPMGCSAQSEFRGLPARTQGHSPQTSVPEQNEFCGIVLCRKKRKRDRELYGC